MRDDGKKNDRGGAPRNKLSTVCFALFIAFAAAAVACVVAYIITRIDVLFIPIALCAVVAMLTFTYARIGRS